MSGLFGTRDGPLRVVCMRVYARVCCLCEGGEYHRGILVLVFLGLPHCLVAEDLISFEQPSGSFYPRMFPHHVHFISILPVKPVREERERSKSY